MKQPLVTCIMTTRNRRRFVGQSLRYFLRQDYSARELVVVDDGEDAVRDLIPEDDRIRYLRVPSRRPLGANRNLACRWGSGELIAHWDDDDWIASDRLTLQVRALLASDADVCGAGDLLSYDLRAGTAWRYRPLPGDRPWVAGGSLLYRRAVWERHPFREIDDGEDTAFVREVEQDRLLRLEGTRFYVALLHGGNGGAKNLRDPRWERRPFEEVVALIAPDRDFYAGLRRSAASRRGSARAGRAAPVVPQTNVAVVAPFAVHDGYGSMAEYIVLGMARAHARVAPIPLTIDTSALTSEFRGLLRRSRSGKGDPVLWSAPVGPGLDRFTTTDLFVHTMWESSRLPRSWVGPLNQARVVIVPSTFLVRVLRSSGVTVPLEVVPDGIDPDVYRFVERAPREGLTTLVVATPIPRKHLREALLAWQIAFEGDPEARLILKSRFGLRPDIAPDPRIEVASHDQRTRGIADVYARADVLLTLGNEGFGLPLVEAMATGLPVVALRSEGHRDVAREARDLALWVHPTRWERVDEAPYGECGIRAVPGAEDAASKLRWVAEHREEAREMGRAASDWAREHRNVWSKGPAILDVMEEHLRPARPLRKVRTLLVPSLGTRCGISEYTQDLSRSLRDVRVTRDWPDPRGLRVIHVQHEDGILGDDDFTRRVTAIASARVPIAVTEHSVTNRTRPWERDADALVALTERGVRTLRARWPDKTIELIPHGCHTWFPPRKRSRARVIGTFGFLERHKGLVGLLEVLRRLPGTTLLMLCHPRNLREHAWWSEAVRGVPADRIEWLAEFLPADEIARRLADQADVLVFWYDDVPHASASGAVRVGLATGVPVIASSTSWFEELREVTYQPADLMEGVERLLDDTVLRDRLTAAARDYCHEHSWSSVAGRHEALWRTLECA